MTQPECQRPVPSRRLLLLCHAPTAATRGSAFAHDEPPEPEALTAVRTLRRRLPVGARVLSSPARAAVETARVLAGEVEITALLADCDFGRWRGHTLEQVWAAEPAAAQSWLTDPHAAPHGGETIVQLIARTAVWLDGLGAGGTLVAVTHQAVIRAALLQALGAGPRGFWRIDIPPLGLVELRGSSGRWQWRAALA